jgi:hypothetical protein
VKREHNQYTQVYNHNISLSRSYYNLGSRFSYTKESLKPKDASKDISKFAKVKNTLVQNILFVLGENVIHHCPKPEDPSTVPNSHQFGPPTDNPCRHRQKEKEAHHLHTGDNKSKA